MQPLQLKNLPISENLINIANSHCVRCNWHLSICRRHSLVAAMKLFSILFSLSRRAYSSLQKPQIRTRTRTRPSRKSPIFESLYRSIAHLGDPNVSVVPALDEWIRQGNSAKKWDLQRVITELMTSKRFRHALEVCFRALTFKRRKKKLLFLQCHLWSFP